MTNDTQKTPRRKRPRKGSKGEAGKSSTPSKPTPSSPQQIAYNKWLITQPASSQIPWHELGHQEKAQWKSDHSEKQSTPDEESEAENFPVKKTRLMNSSSSSEDKQITNKPKRKNAAIPRMVLWPTVQKNDDALEKEKPAIPVPSPTFQKTNYTAKRSTPPIANMVLWPNGEPDIKIPRYDPSIWDSVTKPPSSPRRKDSLGGNLSCDPATRDSELTVPGSQSKRDDMSDLTCMTPARGSSPAKQSFSQPYGSPRNNSMPCDSLPRPSPSPKMRDSIDNTKFITPVPNSKPSFSNPTQQNLTQLSHTSFTRTPKLTNQPGFDDSPTGSTNRRFFRGSAFSKTQTPRLPTKSSPQISPPPVTLPPPSLSNSTHQMSSSPIKPNPKTKFPGPKLPKLKLPKWNSPRIRVPKLGEGGGISEEWLEMQGAFLRDVFEGVEGAFLNGRDDGEVEEGGLEDGSRSVSGSGEVGDGEDSDVVE